jgi:hypothetical protein
MSVLVSPEMVESALDSMRLMLRADGYGLDTRVDGPVVEIIVSATPDACAECLVPKEMFMTMAVDLLRGEGVDVATLAISVIYPEDR